MQSKWLGRIGFAALVMGVAGSSGVTMGCASERDPINRVQLNALPKSFFVGQNYDDPSDDPKFYGRSMVINVPYGESSSDFLMFTNTVNSVSKIKWEITETKLVGRIAFERVPGTDAQGLTPSNPTQADSSIPLAQNNGLVVYEFPIESQFDIRRDYNSQTGEESNVIVENSTDRPWNQRDYIRVDFSQNLVTTAYDFDTLSLLGVYNGIEYAPLQYDVRDPNDKDAPVLDLDNGYFDVTNKVFANPKTIDLGDGFILPGCMLPNLIQGGTMPSGNCNPNEITVRHSFRRVVDKDYEPVDWDGFRFEAYGAFTTDRYGYARDYGLADANWHRFISRYNIWDRSHYYSDPEHMTGAVQCVTDDDCKQNVPSDVSPVAGMSHCDTFASKCTLPYTQRKAKPIFWYYADGSPAMYYESTREATEEWDAAMRGAVLSAKYAECQRFTPGQDCGTPITGNWADEEDSLYLVKEINACKRGEVQGTAPEQCNDLADQIGTSRGYSQAVIATAKADPMVYLCHSPVDKTDPEGCGKVGTVARLGDLRFHLITAVEKVETNSPWGIMSDANDPETGEKLAASVNIWTHVNDLFSRALVDTLRYIGGELKTEDITDGKYVENWVQAARNLNTGVSPLLSQGEVDKRIAAAAGTSVEQLKLARAQMTPINGKLNGQMANGKLAQLRNDLVADLKKVQQTKASWDAPSVNAPLYAARATMAKGTTLEAAAVTPAMQQLATGGSSFGVLDPNVLTKAVSVFQGLNPQLRRSFEQRLEMGLAKRGACIMNFEASAPLGYIALGDMLQTKFGNFNPNDPPAVQSARADKMKDFVRRRAQYAVISHEMGHSWGERHNFVSSSDAWNFRPQYWLLRTNGKKLSSKQCKDGDDGTQCVGPRWIDPVTQNESKNLIHMWAQSSTMEYPGEPSQDLMALGRYDFGAARMFYGDVATVYDTKDKRFLNTAGPGAMAQDHQDDFGGLLGYSYLGVDHYSQLDAQASLIEGCNPVKDIKAFQPVNWNADKDGAWHNIMDGHIVSDESGQLMRCTEPQVDFVQWTALSDDSGKTHAHDKSGRVRVPHGFASDDWADLGNVAVYRHDNGADIYETMQFWQAQQEVTHIFTNYRRGRTDFSIWGAFNRTLSRYHEKMRDSAKAIALYATLARDTVSEYDVNGDPSAFMASVLQQYASSNTLASSIAFDHFAHVFSRPEPGDHAKVGTDTVLRALNSLGGYGGLTNPGNPVLSVPNGVMGGYGEISLGGRPIENALAEDKGRDYNRDFTLNVGDYYEKAFTGMLFSESADNFISANREDFVDPRFRAVSVADVFPDGYRRWLANNLTGDDDIKGVFVRGTGSGPQPAPPDLDKNGFATIGFTQWWPTQGIETCFPQGERLTCRDPFASTPITTNVGVGPVLDPQVGWEQQKFAIIMALMYIPENSRVNWLDQFRIYQLGEDPDPGFDNRIEFHSPDGTVYIARTYGTETLYGKTVQKGIAARVLEYANEVLKTAVTTTPVVGKTATWNLPTVDPLTGDFTYLQPGGAKAASCDQSRDCTKVTNYMSVPKLMRSAGKVFGFWDVGGLKGVY